LMEVEGADLVDSGLALSPLVDPAWSFAIDNSVRMACLRQPLFRSPAPTLSFLVLPASALSGFGGAV